MTNPQAQEIGKGLGEFASVAGGIGVDAIGGLLSGVLAGMKMTEESAKAMIQEQVAKLRAQGLNIGVSKDGLTVIDFTSNPPLAYVADKTDLFDGPVESLQYSIHKIPLNSKGEPDGGYIDKTLFFWAHDGCRLNGKGPHGTSQERTLANTTVGAIKQRFAEAKEDNAAFVQAQAAAAEAAKKVKAEKLNAFAKEYFDNEPVQKPLATKALAGNITIDTDFEAFCKVVGIEGLSTGMEKEQKYYILKRYVNDGGTGHLTKEELDKLPEIKKYAAQDTTLPTTNEQSNTTNPAGAAAEPSKQEGGFDIMKMLKDAPPLVRIIAGVAALIGPEMVMGIVKMIFGKDNGIVKFFDGLVDNGLMQFLKGAAGWTLIADGGMAMIGNLMGGKNFNKGGESVVAGTVGVVTDMVKDPSSAPDVIKAPLQWFGVDTTKQQPAR